RTTEYGKRRITQRAKWISSSLAVRAGPSSVLRRRSTEHQVALPLDERPHLLRDHAEQPGQLHFDPHVILGDVDRARRGLAEHDGAKIEMITGPGLVDDGELLSEGRPCVGEAGFQAAHGLLFAEPVRDGNDERAGHAWNQGSEVSGQMSDIVRWMQTGTVDPGS